MAGTGDDADAWRAHRAEQERLWAEATPQQRFAWLEQAWMFAWRARRATIRVPAGQPPPPETVN